MSTSQMYDPAGSGAIAPNSLVTSINGVPVINSMVLAEGLGIAHRALIATIRKHLASVQRFGRVLFEKLPLKTRGGSQLVTQVNLNENQALFVGSLSDNSQQVVEFKVTLVLEFDKARKAMAEYAHTAILQRQESLVTLCNNLLTRFSGLEQRFDGVSKQYGQVHEAKLTHEEQEQMDIRVKRERIFTTVTTIIRRTNGTWAKFWDSFEYSYHADVRGLKSLPNELLLDTAIRCGYLDQLVEFVSFQ